MILVVIPVIPVIPGNRDTDFKVGQTIQIYDEATSELFSCLGKRKHYQ